MYTSEDADAGAGMAPAVHVAADPLARLVSIFRRPSASSSRGRRRAYSESEFDSDTLLQTLSAQPQLCVRVGEADSDRHREAPGDAEGGDGISLDLPPFHVGKRIQSLELPSMCSSDPIAISPARSSIPMAICMASRSRSLSLDPSESSSTVRSLESIPEEIPASIARSPTPPAPRSPTSPSVTGASRLACRIRSAVEFASGSASLSSSIASPVDVPCSPAREEARSGSSSSRASYRNAQGLESALTEAHSSASSRRSSIKDLEPLADREADRTRPPAYGQLSRTHLHPHNCNRFDHELMAPTHDWEEEIARRLGTAAVVRL
eukprot:tig00000254_g22491.t1